MDNRKMYVHTMGSNQLLITTCFDVIDVKLERGKAKRGHFMRVLFSYDTPVLVEFPDVDKVFVTDHFFSVTTSKHINKYLGGQKENAEPVPQAEIERLANAESGLR